MTGGHAALIGLVTGALKGLREKAPILRTVSGSNTAIQGCLVEMNEGPGSSQWYVVQVFPVDPPERVTDEDRELLKED